MASMVSVPPMHSSRPRVISPLVLLLCLVVPHAAGAWQTVTVYDILPRGCRHKVADNDVGNPRGDMYFMLKDKYLPLACAACKEDPTVCQGDPSTFDCTNVESTGNLVVRQIDVAVRGFSDDDYQLCDVWPNASRCEYSCYSRSWFPASNVGREKVCGGEQQECNMAPVPGSYVPRWNHTFPNASWDYWNYNLAALLGDTGGGEWYSLVAKDEGRVWRNATIVKTISATCQARGVDRLVQQRGSPCFSRCPEPTNQSSRCWIECFFATVLGPAANATLKPPGRQTGAMDVAELEAAWLSGFRSDDEAAGANGCPPLPPGS